MPIDPLDSLSEMEASVGGVPEPAAPEEPVAEDLPDAIRIRNIVCSVNLGIKIDLKRVALGVRNAEYNPKRFSAAILKIRAPKATALVFSSGKVRLGAVSSAVQMVCMGMKSEDEAGKAVRCFQNIISKVGFVVSETRPVIHNIVGTTDCGFPVRLEGIVDEFSGNSTYEPELFPGLIFRFPNLKVVIIIFVSGKLVITGAKTIQQISDARTAIAATLLKYRKGR